MHTPSDGFPTGDVALFELPLSIQLMTAAQWSLTPGREADAIALIEHVAQTYRIENDEQAGVTWH